MPETGHPTKQALISETATLVERLMPHVGSLRDNEREFVESLESKLKQYGSSAFISARQLFWLRDLEQKHVPDERQATLFQ